MAKFPLTIEILLNSLLLLLVSLEWMQAYFFGNLYVHSTPPATLAPIGDGLSQAQCTSCFGGPRFGSSPGAGLLQGTESLRHGLWYTTGTSLLSTEGLLFPLQCKNSGDWVRSMLPSCPCPRHPEAEPGSFRISPECSLHSPSAGECMSLHKWRNYCSFPGTYSPLVHLIFLC